MTYVSSDLTHFVGRSLPSDRHRYDLLSKIIRDGLLLDPSHLGQRYPIFRVVIPGDPGDGIEYSSYPSVRHDMDSKLSENALVQFELVCFCDIPLNELTIHCSKYGCFGLAFSKSFLVSRGASPVMYVPRPGSFEMTLREHHVKSGSLQFEESKSGERAALIDDVFKLHNQLSYKRYEELQDAFPRANSKEEAGEIVRKLRTTLFYQTAVEAYIYGHLKFFDPMLPDDHIDNYYMEREWRVAGSVRFALEDLQRIFVSPEFVNQARTDFPELAERIATLAS